MSDPAATTQVLGKAGEPCAGCGAPLAEDQRYCLNCGRRRGDPRVDFQQYEKPAPAPAPQRPEPKPSRDYTPLAAVGGIAVLGVMLLIGVLIGKGGDGGTATAPAPVVVRGSGEGSSGENTAGKGAGTESKSKPAKSQASGKGKGGGGGAVEGGSAGTGSAPVASDAELRHLQEQSPQEYAENSAKLPDEIATGGAPPPEDNKAPGGGSGGSTIE